MFVTWNVGFKPDVLFELSGLFASVGDLTCCNRL